MILVSLAVLAVAYLPGALLFRLPVASRERRATLPAEERVFWHVVISLAWSISVVLALAALDAYRFDRLLMANGALVVGCAIGARARLGYSGSAARMGATALVPIALLVFAGLRFFPSSEYIIGGKDPGGYVNEGVLIAKRGSLVIYEAEVAALPAAVRTPLFFNSHGLLEYFDNRFMGFFLKDPETGKVVGQFPHVYPASIAVAYDIAGIRAAVGIVGGWAMLGCLAVYFLGARLVGRPAAFAAGVLLALNLAEVFFARYPNAEVVMQALLFAALLALSRAQQDGDRFFAPVAGVLVVLLVFLRQDAPLPVAAIGLATILAWILDRKRPPLGFLAPLAAGAVLGWFYWSGPMQATFYRTQAYVSRLPMLQVTLGLTALALLIGLALRLRDVHAERLRTAIPIALTVVLVGLALYAWWLRVPGGKLADFDAATFRTFVTVYGQPLGMAAALVGLAIVVPRRFWTDPAFAITTATFAIFFFFKLQIVQEHLWLARRFVPVILPSMLLFASAAALGTWERRPRGPQVIRVAIGALVLIILGQQYRMAAAPAASHVEFKGLLAHVDDLASRLTERDLLVVESRGASDVHVLSIPLAYVYGRRVLVLENQAPDKGMFETFLADALTKYERVFFLGGGGTDLVSPGIRATPVAYVQREVPSFLATPWNAYRAGIRAYKFHYSLYRLEVGASPSAGFSLDVGFEDDLQVVRLGDKEMTDGRTFRWVGRQSFISVRGLTGREREIVLEMSDGGRPAAAGPAAVDVFLGETDVPLGRIVAESGFREYRLSVSPEDLRRAMASPGRQIRLVATTWKPSAFLNSPDTRDLGVMLDRVEIR